MNIIEVKNLCKQFDDFKAVKNIDFTVTAGEVFGFLGPNGAGKTTTINMLTGLAKPTSGQMTIANQDGIHQIKKVQSLIGIVPDESNLYDDLSGFDNLVFCASLYGIPKVIREERARQLLKQFSLDDTGTRPFKAYSKGMKRKLTIAAGIIHEPGILFLDEPTTGIDVESARQIRKMIQSLNRQGTTIFMTTHYIEDAERLCDRIGFIVDGRIIKISSVKDLLAEAEQYHRVEFSFEKKITSALDAELNNRFPYLTILIHNENSLRLQSYDPIRLMPLMTFFEQSGNTVTEAKIIRPSLEDVFVTITGIEIHKLKKEKGGKKK